LLIEGGELVKAFRDCFLSFLRHLVLLIEGGELVKAFLDCFLSFSGNR
jgi:hypothetical protein